MYSDGLIQFKQEFFNFFTGSKLKILILTLKKKKVNLVLPHLLEITHIYLYFLFLLVQEVLPLLQVVFLEMLNNEPLFHLVDVGVQ